MDIIPFLEKKDFPLNSNALDLMQINYQKIAEYLVKFMGVTDAVISGVILMGINNYSAGIVVIDGELLPFNASIGNYVEIKEEKKTTNTASGEYTVLKKRYAQATSSNTKMTMSKLRAIMINVNDIRAKMSIMEGEINAIRNSVATKANIASLPSPLPHFRYDSELISFDETILDAHYTDTGFVCLSGRIDLKPYTFTPNRYNDLLLFNFNDVTTNSPSLKKERFILNNYRGIIFPAVCKTQNGMSYVVCFCSTDFRGDFLLQTDPSTVFSSRGNYLYINLVFYNPKQTI